MQSHTAKPKTGTSKDTSRTSSALKLGGKKKPEPDFGFDDWGSDNSWGLDTGGSTKSNTSRTSKSSGSDRTSKVTSNTKTEKKSDDDFGGWGNMDDWGDMDGGDDDTQIPKNVGTADDGGGGWGDDDDDWGPIEETKPEPTKVSTISCTVATC